jgi:hypothetical protein
METGDHSKNGASPKSLMSRGIILFVLLLSVVVCNAQMTASQIQKQAQTSAKYDSIAPYSEGMAAVRLDGKWGYIDKTGKEVIPNKYNIAKYFSFGYAFVKLEDKWQIINQKGEEFNYTILDKDLELLRLKVNDKIAYIDKTAKLVTPLKYDKANELDKNIAFTQIGDKFGVVGKSGEITEPKYDKVFAVSEGFRIVMQNDKYGYIDNETGKEITPIEYYNALDFKNGLAKVQIYDEAYDEYMLWNYIDKTGKVKYDEIEMFEEGLAAVKLNGKWGFIDTTGKEIIPSQYDEVEKYRKGLAAVKLNGKWGLINKTGKNVIPMKYDYTRYLGGEHIIVTLNEKYGVIDKNGKEVIPIKYDFVNYDGDIFTAKLNGKFLWVDQQGNEYKNAEDAKKKK